MATRSRENGTSGEGPRRPDIDRALQVFHPSRFGYHQYGRGWAREFPGLARVAITALSWEHIQTPSYDYEIGEDGAFRQIPTNALDFLVGLQQSVWGFSPVDAVPSNTVAILKDTRAAALVAYDADKGFNADGWLGFAIGFGSESGTLVSHMVGVREGLRGNADLGWNLKIVQAYEALRTGHDSMQWTYDPMRGANARLNVEKLGGVIEDFTVDKYGILNAGLYGQNPSDRFTVSWNIADNRVQQRVEAIRDGEYTPLDPQLVPHIPVVDGTNVAEVEPDKIEKVLYQIPGEIEQIQQSPELEVTWRRDMRAVFSTLLNTSRAEGDTSDPALFVPQETQGGYVVNGFATGKQDGQRKSFYVLTRRAA